MRVQLHESVSEIPEAAWNGLLGQGAPGGPFVDHRWLSALERSGCAVARRGWTGRHLTLWRGADLVGAAPAWIKEDSDADFSRDFGWAESALRAGISYYPKLVIGVPFTPCTGTRLLVAPGEERAAIFEALLTHARAMATELGLSSVHVLFSPGSDADLIEACGLDRRIDFQFHWLNAGYRTMDDFLARLSSKRRNQLRRELRAPAEQGIEIATLRGAGGAFAAAPDEWARHGFRLYRATIDKLMWGRGWLNEPFFREIFRSMPEALELVLARLDGRIVAGAFNVATSTHLYGRYWGCFEEHPFLHFNVCLYHSIQESIRRGVQVFEGGAGGEHKLVRGFEPVRTHSNHWFVDPRLSSAVSAYLASERAEREAALERWQAGRPIFRRETMLKEE